VPEETFVWVVTKTGMRWAQSNRGSSALRHDVAALRCGLDRAAWDGDGASKCSELLGLPLDSASDPNRPLPFSVTRAHDLYAVLFSEVRDLIAGKHLLIVPSGPLQQLPFQVLVSQQPGSDDLRGAHWLVRDHAITVLPSVASLEVLRHTAKPSAAPEPFIGFANPLLDGPQSDARFGAYFKALAATARGIDSCAPSSANQVAMLRGVRRAVTPVPSVAGHASLSHIRVQDPLPETAGEVCTVAQALGASADAIRLGERATEHEIKALSASGALARYRIVHFATHGALAGEINDTREPGLILTPPPEASDEDDGYLSASEIAALKLDADWVILSACNTAGGDGKGEAGAEALSGLARTFFYAGARALLVSHWAVNSQATVKLITSAVSALARDPHVGRAEALRQAMLAMIDHGEAREADPANWAPFVVVGEGSAAP
jgi:CHAT domain-containing protein